MTRLRTGGTRGHAGDGAGASWRSIDELFGSRPGRPPTLAERRAAEADERGLSSGDYDSDDRGMSVDPDSIEFGRPPQRRRGPAADDRPFRRAIDEWLGRGGWAAGIDGAASLQVQWATEVEKRRVVNRWRFELVEVRGWSADLVASRFEEGLRGEQRFYWWTTPSAVSLGAPPDPPLRRGG